MTETRILSDIKDANFPEDELGRVYHLAVKRGEVANRIISVGDPQRAELLSTLLDSSTKIFKVVSKRGFIIYTGKKNNIPVTIIATGMGIPMIDFVVRESRAIVEGPMLFIRLGTCGTPTSNIKVGTISVASPGSICIRRDPDAFHESNKGKIPYYSFSKIIPSDSQLSDSLSKNLQKNIHSGLVTTGLNATADSFYSSQGRISSFFEDHNSDLVENLSHFGVITLEMETFHLLDLARCSFGTIKATAATIVLAQRKSNDFLDHATLVRLEKEAGESCLETIVSFPLEGKMMDDEMCVWNKEK